MLFAPVARICQSLSLKEKSRALAASKWWSIAQGCQVVSTRIGSVKYKAFDVVASYKILVAIVIVPM